MSAASRLCRIYFGLYIRGTVLPRALDRLLVLSLVLSIAVPTAAFADGDDAWPSEDSSAGAASSARPAPAGEHSGFSGTSANAGTAENSGNSGGSGSGLHAEEASLAPAGGNSGRRAAAPERAEQAPAHKTAMLYGRIDQIASEADVSMPVLKALKPKLDTSENTLKASASRLTAAAQESRFSGSVTRSFPMDYTGTWGGSLKVWRYSASSLSSQIDPAESARMQQILTPGQSGTVNLIFAHDTRGTIELEPPKVRIMIPASESYSYKQMANNPQMGGMGGMVSQMMANMKIPVILHFGQVSTRGSMEVGVSGNQIDQTLVKNVIRKLAPTVLEQQIVTRDRSVVAGSGAVHDGYTESVLRITRQSPTQLYVLAASVDYTGSGKFLRKLIMYGTVIRGQVMDTSPIPAGLAGLGGGAGGGAASMSALSTLLGGGAGGGASTQSALSKMLRSYGAGGGYGGSSGQAGGPAAGFGQILNSLQMMSR